MSTDVQADIFEKLIISFPCAAKYESDVAMLLLVHLDQAHSLNKHSVKSVMKGLQKKLCKEKWMESKVMFGAVFVYIMIHQKILPNSENFASFLQRYPEFAKVHCINELNALMNFCDVLNVAQLILKPSKSKKNFLHMVDRICGGMHLPGVGQLAESVHRVLIYERETGVPFREQQVPTSRMRSFTEDSTLASPQIKSGTTKPTVITPPAPVPTAPQTPLASVLHTIDSAEDTDASRERTRLWEREEAHTRMLLAEGRAFWLQHAQRMECGRDIPWVLVPPQDAYTAFAYPSHDLPQYPATALQHRAQFLPQTSGPQAETTSWMPHRAPFSYPTP